MSRAVMQQALEALEMRCGTNAEERGPDGVITALKQALAEPEQEPVAWMQEMPVSGNEERSVRMTTVKMVADEWDNPIPLYTAPTPRKPVELTDGEIGVLWKRHTAQYNPYDDDGLGFAHAVIAAYEAKNGIGEQHE